MLRAAHVSIEELAKKKGVSMAQIAMAWVMAKPGVTAPIIGTTSMANLEDILGKSVCLALVGAAQSDECW